MQKTKNHYIKYTRTELENYTKLPESCVQKINCVEPIRFSPTIIADFQPAILRILSKKIGKYDAKLNGIVLDFRNTKVMGSQSGIRQDSAFSVINVETNFYVFSPRKGAVVTGDLKYINRMNMETVLTVVIYRVFNVKVTVKGKVKQEIERNQEIKIRVKDFHFNNVIPFVEGKLCSGSFQFRKLNILRLGEIIDDGILIKPRKIFDDTIDSGISESSVTSEVHRVAAGTSGVKPEKIKQERASSVESSTESREKSKKNRKRKAAAVDSDSDNAPTKKVKSEPLSPVEEDKPAVPRIKREKISDSEDSTPKSSSKLPAASSKEKKSKKKKKKRIEDSDDDFETSLQNLLNSAIKIRK